MSFDIWKTHIWNVQAFEDLYVFVTVTPYVQLLFNLYDIICSCSVRLAAYLHTDHTLCSLCDERQWMSDAQTSVVLLGGEFRRMFRPFKHCWDVGSCRCDAVWKLQLSNILFHGVASYLGLLLTPHQTHLSRPAYRKGAAIHRTADCPESPQHSCFLASLKWKYDRK